MSRAFLTQKPQAEHVQTCGEGKSVQNLKDCSSVRQLGPACKLQTFRQLTAVMHEHTITLRVRYPEVDAMGVVHHSRFLQYFEIGRVEMLRAMGCAYADLEKQGVFFVVVKAEVKFRSPARYDEELALTTKLVKVTHVRFDHSYVLKRGETILAEGTTTIACVDRAGQVIQIPEGLRRE
jgi:acyl-CoA thioester hydrolase